MCGAGQPPASLVGVAKSGASPVPAGYGGDERFEEIVGDHSPIVRLGADAANTTTRR